MSNNKGTETRIDTDAKADKKMPSDIYKKLPGNPAPSQDDNSISTADDSSGGQYAKTGTRKEDKNTSNRQSN